MESLQSLALLNDLKLIVIDYIGENKHQLNYKECIKEYYSFFKFNKRLHFVDKMHCGVYNWRHSWSNSKYIYRNNRQVTKLPLNYYYQQLYN